MTDITCIVTGHVEGRKAAPTLRSMRAAVGAASKTGLSVETLLVLDRANAATEAVFKQFSEDATIVETDFGDQGKARNMAVKTSKGRRIAFLDGDDLWSRTWLVEASAFLDGQSDSVIAHPEFNYFFEGQATIFRQIDQDSPDFSLDLLRIANYWDALCMADRKIFEAHPYSERDLANGWAFEDWQWNCETVVDGLRHKVVPDTVLFKRRQKISQTIMASGNKSRIRRMGISSYSNPLFTSMKEPG